MKTLFRMKQRYLFATFIAVLALHPSSAEAVTTIFFKDLTEAIEVDGVSTLETSGLPESHPDPLEIFRSKDGATVFFRAPTDRHGPLKAGESPFGHWTFTGFEDNLVASSLQILEHGTGIEVLLSDQVTIGTAGTNFIAVTFSSENSLSAQPFDRSVPNVFEDGTEQIAATITWNFQDGSTDSVVVKFQSDAEITPAPEPSTYGIIGALALLGVVIVHRKKTAVRGMIAR